MPTDPPFDSNVFDPDVFDATTTGRTLDRISVSTDDIETVEVS